MKKKYTIIHNIFIQSLDDIEGNEDTPRTATSSRTPRSMLTFRTTPRTTDRSTTSSRDCDTGRTDSTEDLESLKERKKQIEQQLKQLDEDLAIQQSKRSSTKRVVYDRPFATYPATYRRINEWSKSRAENEMGK